MPVLMPHLQFNFVSCAIAGFEGSNLSCDLLGVARAQQGFPGLWRVGQFVVLIAKH